MANLDFVLTTLNTNIKNNAAIYSSQFDSVGRNWHLLAAPPRVYRGKNIFHAWKDRRLTLGTKT